KIERRTKEGRDVAAPLEQLRQPVEAGIGGGRGDFGHFHRRAGDIERRKAGRRLTDPAGFAPLCRRLAHLPSCLTGNTMSTWRPGERPESSKRPPWNFITALARLRPRPEPGWVRLASSRTK